MDKKPWYQSITVWGAALVTISAVLLPMFGKPEIATTIQEQQTSIMEILTKIGEVVGLVVVIIGRFRAKTNLTK